MSINFLLDLRAPKSLSRQRALIDVKSPTNCSPIVNIVLLSIYQYMYRSMASILPQHIPTWVLPGTCNVVNMFCQEHSDVSINPRCITRNHQNNTIHNKVGIYNNWSSVKSNTTAFKDVKREFIYWTLMFDITQFGLKERNFTNRFCSQKLFQVISKNKYFTQNLLNNQYHWYMLLVKVVQVVEFSNHYIASNIPEAMLVWNPSFSRFRTNILISTR